MSSLYTSLNVSPRKKRCPPDNDEFAITPKKIRTAPPTPTSISRSKIPSSKPQLPSHLARLFRYQTALQQALSHALATCAMSPSSDSGLVMNVLNHVSLTTYAGFTTSFGLDELKQLCWIWEWNAESVSGKGSGSDLKTEEDNPFLDPSSVASGTGDWSRRSMGFVMSTSTHYSKLERKRIPVYGIGIEVEVDIDKDMGGGMAAVARWTAAGESRRLEFYRKLERWVELHADKTNPPPIPFADLPPLRSSKTSSLTRTLASQSPKGSASPQNFPTIPSSPSISPSKKQHQDFAVPFPAKTRSPTKSATLLFPQTPSRHHSSVITIGNLIPETSSSIASPSISSSLPSTPVHQRGLDAETVPQTPSTSRRQALYERIRQRSLSKSPTKNLSSEVPGGSLTRDQMLKLSQEEMRRRCLLGRLSGIAESVWMLFTHPASGPTSTPGGRKRRTMPLTEVATAIVKSSSVPISMAEACESLNMLVQLCPFFLKKVVIIGNDWLEMPSSITASVAPGGSSPMKSGSTSASPGFRIKIDPAQELVSRSPKMVKNMPGGLRQVREIIRREMELQD